MPDKTFNNRQKNLDNQLILSYEFLNSFKVNEFITVKGKAFHFWITRQQKKFFRKYANFPWIDPRVKTDETSETYVNILLDKSIFSFFIFHISIIFPLILLSFNDDKFSSFKRSSCFPRKTRDHFDSMLLNRFQ